MKFLSQGGLCHYSTTTMSTQYRGTAGLPTEKVCYSVKARLRPKVRAEYN